MSALPELNEGVVVRPTRPGDLLGIAEMSHEVYGQGWKVEELAQHLEHFPEGQLVAVTEETDVVVGMAASLIVTWDDYDLDQPWRDFTAHGTFANHDPSGRTLYGAEVMVRPGLQGRGIGRKLYADRRELVRRFGLLRIRAGARLRGYGAVADEIPATEYVRRVVRGELGDPTLSFQLREGFAVLAVVSGYLRFDPESRGWAAVIEWLNPELATPEDHARQAKRLRWLLEA